MARISREESLERAINIMRLLDEEKMDPKEVAIELDLSISTVRRVKRQTIETRETYVQRQRVAWDLRTTKGLTHQKIADELGVERSTITKMLGRITSRAIETLDTDIAGAVIEQWGILENMVTDSLEEWERSKKSYREIRRKVKGDGQNLKDGDTEVTTVARDQTGDAIYLRTAMAAMADIRDLLGMNAPTEIVIDDWSGEIVGLLKKGLVEPGQIIKDFGNDIAIELFDEAGLDVKVNEESSKEETKVD